MAQKSRLELVAAQLLRSNGYSFIEEFRFFPNGGGGLIFSCGRGMTVSVRVLLRWRA